VATNKSNPLGRRTFLLRKVEGNDGVDAVGENKGGGRGGVGRKKNILKVEKKNALARELKKKGGKVGPQQQREWGGGGGGKGGVLSKTLKRREKK